MRALISDKFIIVVVAIVLVATFAVGMGVVIPKVLSNIYPVPEQPFVFPHQTHADVAALDCQFCHRNADQTNAATVPAVEQCVFCHKIITGGDGTITAQVRDAWDTGQPITWARVHRLPDTVRFWHEPHIRVLSDLMSAEQGRDIIPSEVCATCHGDVASVKQVEQVRTLKMADCVECHRAKNAPTDCSTCHY